MQLNKTSISDVENLSLPVALVNGNGGLVQWSKSFRALLNGNQQWISFKKFLQCPKTMGNAFQKDRFVKTFGICCKKNGLYYVKLHAHRLPKDPAYFHLFIENVTEEKEQSDLGFRANRIAKIGSWSVNLLTNKIFWSPVTKEIHEVPLDYEPNLEEGINFYKKGENRDIIVQKVSECIEKGTSYDVELVIVTAKGNEKWVRAMGEPDQVNGKTIGFSGVFQDIDQRKKQQKAYKALYERTRIALKSANIGVWDLDIANNNLFWDDNMFALYGTDKHSFDSTFSAWEKTVHPEDLEKTKLKVDEALEGKSELDNDFRIIKKDGSIAYIHAEAKVFWDDSGKPIRMIGANTDVTSLKRKDKRLRSLLEMTERQNNRLLNFTNILSHNLRSNSSNISMLSGMLDSRLSVTQQVQFIEMIRVSAKNLEDTIVELNDIVKIQATDESQFKEVFVKKTIEQAINGINALLMQASTTITMDIDEELKILGVDAYLQSVFHNLLTNSIKYRRAGIPLKIRISSHVLAGKICILFSDNGIGIDLQKFGTKLFGMYKTFHGNDDARGIGLFITKNHIETMNGSIGVESEPNKGATFKLFFNQLKR